MIQIFLRLLFSLLILTLTLPAGCVDLMDADQRFLALRDAALKEDSVRANELASQLSDYSLSSYVDYFQIKAHLRTASDSEISNFLSRYANTAIADRLRNDWLLILGHHNNWARFDQQYPLFVLNDDSQVKCYALLSALQQGQNVAEKARNLLSSPRVYGEGCYALFSGLLASAQFSSSDQWNQIRWAADTGGVGIKLAKLASLDKTAQMLDHPADKLVADLGRPLGSSDESHQIALIQLGRLAKVDPDAAIVALNHFGHQLSTADVELGWSQIALGAAQKLLPQANSYWHRVGNAPLSNDAMQWRVRSALREADWTGVKVSIEAMPAALLGDTTWVYWLARAYLAENRPDIALPLFHGIAGMPNFYGQLALEETGQQIAVPLATPVSTLSLAALANNEGLQHALQFYALNLRVEGNREWNWQMRGVSEPTLLAAAEFARQHGLLDRMVNTSDRTKTIFDYAQRFPAPHADIMAATTGKLNLDMAWVYGLIRQESRFIMNAHSSAGANGLMQVMPGTARYVVKKMKWDNVDLNRINDTDINILLGSNYLNMILSNLGGSQVLATAGYNAGPNRARAWRASLSSKIEGAIFTETIPYNETRDYVKNVLSNATWYAALFSGRPQSLKQRLGMISPGTGNNPDADVPMDMSARVTPDASPIVTVK